MIEALRANRVAIDQNKTPFIEENGAYRALEGDAEPVGTPKKDEATAKTPAKVEERVYDPANSKVRTVGPAFLPENESAIDLGRPADADVN